VAAVRFAGPVRRRDRRTAPAGTPWQAEAVVRPGLVVRLLNISARGALVESAGRLQPGRLAELQLTAVDGDVRQVARGVVGRCQVARLTPLRYQGAIVFERPLDGLGLAGR